MSEQLTDWFPGDVKPARPGVYERRTVHKIHHFSKWNGKAWCKYRSNVYLAGKSRGHSFLQDAEWRGLAADPHPPTDDSQTDDHTGICEVTE